MHWLDCLLQVTNPVALVKDKTSFWTKIVSLAPLFSALAAVSNLLLAIFVFGYTRRKNTTDVKIKWFLELIYTPNKEAFADYFKNLNTLKEQIPANGQWTEQEKIDVMGFVKSLGNKFTLEFVDMLAIVTPTIYKEVSSSVENLTDTLVKAIDNDELKLENHKTYAKQIHTPILKAKGDIISAIFKYKG